MSTTVQKKTRVIAQGETYIIFVTLKTSYDGLPDKVWAQTNEGYESSYVEDPPYNQPFQLEFTGEDTDNFTVGDHIVRIWCTKDDLDYVLCETKVIVNPRFPVTSETSATYALTDEWSNSAYQVDGTDTATSYPNFSGRLSSTLNTSFHSQTYVISSPDELPTIANVGSFAVVTKTGEMEDAQSYYLCVSSDPILWIEINTVSEEDSIYIMDGDTILWTSIIEDDTEEEEGVIDTTDYTIYSCVLEEIDSVDSEYIYSGDYVVIKTPVLEREPQLKFTCRYWD